MIKEFILSGFGLLLAIAGMYLCAWLDYTLNAQHWATGPTVLLTGLFTGGVFIFSSALLIVALVVTAEEWD